MEELSKVKKKYNIYDSIIAKGDNVHDFFNGTTNEYIVGDYDIWKVAKRVNISPRSGDFPTDFVDAENELIKNCSERLAKYKGKLDLTGDWDEGPIVIVYVG